MILDLLGLTPEKIAKGETWDPTEGERTRDAGDKFGDWAMSTLTGTDYAAEVEKHARGNYTKKMEGKYGGRLDDVKDVAGYEAIGDLANLTPKQITEAIQKRENTRNARSAYTALTGEEVEDLTVTDPGTIKAKATRTLKDEEKTEKEKERQRVQNEVERKEGRADKLLLMQMMQSDAKSERQFQLQQAQQNYQNRKLDMQEARYDRKDRQAAIQQMMAGLAQMGASIAI